MNGIEALNHAWFLSINGGADSPRWLIALATGIARDAVYLLPVLFVGLWLWGGRVCRSTLLKTCVVVVLGLILSHLIGALWPQPRPFVIGLGNEWMPHVADASFPSNHMTVFTAVGLTLLLGRVVWWGVITLLVAVAVAWARIFVGVHFPLDMVGAVIVAAFSWIVLTPAWAAVGAFITDIFEYAYRCVFAWPVARGWVRR